MPRISTAPVLIEDVFTNICNVLSLYTDAYLYTNTTLYRYDYEHPNVFESIKNININIFHWLTDGIHGACLMKQKEEKKKKKEKEKRQMERQRDEMRLTDCYFTLPFFQKKAEKDRSL